CTRRQRRDLDAEVPVKPKALFSTAQPRRKHVHGLAVDPPQRELEHNRRGRVEPLHVIDRDEQWLPGVQDAEKRQQRRRHRTRLGWLVSGFLQEKRNSQRAPLRAGKSSDLVRDRLEEIRERREREVAL